VIELYANVATELLLLLLLLPSSCVCLHVLQGGSDVVTRTALKRINWGSYKISQSSDKVGPAPTP
jgi:hypothetical protein